MIVPALLIGALLGDWVGRQLFAAPGSTADGPAAAGPNIGIQVTLVLPSASAAAPPTAGPSTTPQVPAAQGQPPSNPGNPGNPTDPGGGNPPPASPPPPNPVATTAGPPPPPAWGPQLNNSIQVLASYPTGGTVQVGRAEGWFQLHTDRTKFRYSYTFCRQSSYILPYMAVSVNGFYAGQTWQSTPITTIYPSYDGGCSTVSNEHGYSPIQNVYFRLHGSTFIGSDHVVFSQDRTFYNSN